MKRQGEQELLCHIHAEAGHPQMAGALTLENHCSSLVLHSPVMLLGPQCVIGL